VSTGTVNLLVPSAANQDAEVPYSGTALITVDRSPGFTAPVTVALDPATLPDGVQAAFVDAVIPAGATTAQLNLQAGYTDPSDPTLTTHVYPAPGLYPVAITASSPGMPAATGTLTLDLTVEPNDFTLAFFTQTGLAPTILTNLDILPGTTLVEPFEAYWTQGDFASFGPVALTVQGVPSFLAVAVDGRPGSQFTINLNEPHTLTVEGLPCLPAGTFSFQLTASFQGLTRLLPVVLTCSPAPFCIQPLAAGTVAVAQGQSLTFPLYLWHDDVFFEPLSGSDPSYLGATELGWSGTLPSGLEAGFPAGADPTGLASVPLQITAGPAVPPGGPYALTLQAIRMGTTTVSAAPLTLNVLVTSSRSAPTLWIQNVEWGQGVVAPNLRLVGGKPALLRVQLLADRTGVPAPSLTAVVEGADGTRLDTLPLAGPAQVPVAIAEGDLPSAAGPSASSYTAILPGADIQTGMRVTILAGNQGTVATQSFTPSVAPGATLDLTVVPVICQGTAPALPQDAVLTGELAAFWPIQTVALAHRAPYVTGTVMPQPDSPYSGDAWAQLLGEMVALRIADGAASSYYGFVNPGITHSFGFGITGISRIGWGVGIGIDETAAGWFENADPGLDLAATVMVHEVGHGFNLNHAPAGGACNPQLDYPYAGASIGCWGFDPASLAAHDPDQEYDVMSYAAHRHWVSDWNYRSAMAWLDALGTVPGAGASSPAGASSLEQWVVSGWVRPDGQVRLLPLVRVFAPPAPPRAGDHRLRLETSEGVRTISFATEPAADLPLWYRHFCFAVPAAGELASAEVRMAGGRSFRRARLHSLAARAQALDAQARDGSLVVQERGTVLHLEWDAGTHPCLHVMHEGAGRTTLALHLTGGRADLPLAGLPPGGTFVIHYSDGLNDLVRRFPRPTPH
jgi:hypothetical protein